MFRLNLTKHCIKWYCFIQMQLMDTFVHYFVLDCIVISIAAIICSSFVSMAHYRQALFSMTYFSSLVFFVEYALRICGTGQISGQRHKPYTMEIYFFILWFVDSVTILPYMLTYMYWDTNIVHVIILLYIFIIVKQIRYLRKSGL